MCCKIGKYYVSSHIVLSYVISYTISYVQCSTYINSRGVALIKALIKLLQISALTWYQSLSTLIRYFYSLLQILLITAIPALLFFYVADLSLCCLHVLLSLLHIILCLLDMLNRHLLSFKGILHQGKLPSSQVFFNWLFLLFSVTVLAIDHTASAAAGINVNSSPLNSFSPVPGLTTATNTAMAPFTTTVALIPLSNTQQVINLKLTNTNNFF